MPSRNRSQSGGSSYGRRNRRSSRRKQGSALPVVLIVILAVIIVAGAGIWFFRDTLFGSRQYYDAAAVTGQLHENGYTDTISEGSLYPLVNTEITVSSDGTASIGFENVAANPYDLKLTLYLEEKAIYTSGVIQPGQYIEKAALTEKPAAGTYTVTARFIAYDRETKKAVGKADYPETVTMIVE